MSSDERLVDTLLRIASDASALILGIYAQDFEVDYKGPEDPVTRADREANQMICDALRQEFPEAAIVGEESQPESFRGYQAAERIFFVDPLDGTREFVAKNDEFAVMIGLVEGNHARVGVIVAPALSKAWAGIVGAGAWCYESGRRREVRVSQAKEIRNARFVVSRSHPSASLAAAMTKIGLVPVPLGSAGLKAAAVADGSADVYGAPGWAGSRWDACASDALVTAAGGTYTDATGELYNYRTDELTNRDGIAATNGLLHSDVVKLLKSELSPDQEV